ncbi:hypothetical protein [Dermatophilus congolensis]|nr:hypothetical protein [Dermatophilus congolensis]
MSPPMHPNPFSPQTPGPTTHPGPRTNTWEGPTHTPTTTGAPLATIIRALGWGPHFHPNPHTGEPTKLRQRGAPSAGACQPLQWHITCGTGYDLPPGHHTLHPDTGTYTQRNNPNDPPPLPHGHATITITALPQRTAARYHHRSAPAIIGDAAYATALLHATTTGTNLTPHPLPGDATATATRIALPPPTTWTNHWPNTPTEIPLTATHITTPDADPTTTPHTHHTTPTGNCQPQPPTTPTPPYIPDTTDLGLDTPPPTLNTLDTPPPPITIPTLLTRRSPHPHQLTTPTPPNTTAHGHPPLGPWCANQHWIDQTPHLHLFHASPNPHHQWTAHYQAAHTLITHLTHGRNARPISGWTHNPQHGNISHALAVEAP